MFIGFTLIVNLGAFRLISRPTPIATACTSFLPAFIIVSCYASEAHYELHGGLNFQLCQLPDLACRKLVLLTGIPLELL